MPAISFGWVKTLPPQPGVGDGRMGIGRGEVLSGGYSVVRYR
jgi:hypothetical protein